MKKILFISITGILFTACFMGTDPEMNIKRITSDFWMMSSVTDNSYLIIYSTDLEPQGGAVLIKENVVAIWHTKDFIIAKRHPNYKDVISKRLFGNHEQGGDFLLTNPSDTVYLSSEDSIYKKGDNWYHISNGWNPPDSLNPYRAITYYHILDLRNYKRTKHGSYKEYIFDNEDEFNDKKKEFNIPDSIYRYQDL